MLVAVVANNITVVDGRYTTVLVVAVLAALISLAFVIAAVSRRRSWEGSLMAVVVIAVNLFTLATAMSRLLASGPASAA